MGGPFSLRCLSPLCPGAAGVKQAVTDLLAGGIPEELLLASLNAMEFASLERPGSIPDGVLDAINAATGWLHTGDATLLLHTDKLFAALRSKLDGISNTVLASALRELERDGLVTRQEYLEVPVRVEYGPTDSCRALLPILEQLSDWAEARI